MESVAVFEEKLDTLFQSVTGSICSEQCSKSLGKSDAKDVASDPQQPSVYRCPKPELGQKKVASELHHMHDHAVLRSLLTVLTEAKMVIRKNLADDVDVDT